MKQFNNRYELIALAIAITVLMVSIFGVYSQFKNLNQSRELLYEEEQMLDITKARLDSLMELKEKEELLERQIYLFRNAFPQKPRENEIIDIMKGSTTYRGKLNQIEISELIAREDYTEIPLSVSYEGRYKGLVSFLENLKIEARVFRVEKIDITEGSEGFPEIRADISASSFFDEDTLTR